MNIDFYNFFDINYGKIMDVCDEISGKHYIDKDKAELFINSQLNVQRKHAAKLLVDNTYYVTFEELICYIHQIVDKIYSDIGNEDPYFFVESKTDSTYFITILAVKYIRELGYRDPEIIDVLDEYQLERPIIILDDFIYSGTKLYGQLMKVYENTSIRNFKFPKIYLGLVGITNEGRNKIKSLYVPREVEKKYNIKIKGLKNPCKIYTSNLEIKELKEVLTDKDLLKILYYFSPLNSGYPVISIYFDHKIADSTSTFLRALMYGPILPSNLKYSFEDIDESLQYLDMKVDVLKEIRKIRKNDKTKIEKEKIEFIPFINNCNINYSNFENLEYYWFMMSKEQLNKDLENINNILSIHDYEQDHYEETYEGTYDDKYEEDSFYFKEDILAHKDIVEEIQDPRKRCPTSWYKNNILL